jgi:hypothetical protein
MTKLTPKESNFLRYILRSPYAGNGWRVVSRAAWSLVEKFERPELIETKLINGIGYFRLSREGLTVAGHLIEGPR